jgi:hypothetical protein
VLSLQDVDRRVELVLGQLVQVGDAEGRVLRLQVQGGIGE